MLNRSYQTWVPRPLSRHREATSEDLALTALQIPPGPVRAHGLSPAQTSLQEGSEPNPCLTLRKHLQEAQDPQSSPRMHLNNPCIAQQCMNLFLQHLGVQTAAVQSCHWQQ